MRRKGREQERGRNCEGELQQKKMERGGERGSAAAKNMETEGRRQRSRQIRESRRG